MQKKAVLSLSGGLDSTSLLLNLLHNNYEVYAVSFDYGQKHKIEIEKAEKIVRYINKEIPDLIPGCPIRWMKLDLSFMKDITFNSLTQQDIQTPEGFYEASNMKDTVVENRNSIFSSIIFAYALGISKRCGNVPVDIALGVHQGDHTTYPDCRPEFIDAIEYAFKIGNFDSEAINYYVPYLKGDKAYIIGDAINSCRDLMLNWREILGMTNTSYSPLPDGTSEGKTGSDIERILAFYSLGLEDPFKYTKPWNEVLENALKIEQEFKKKNETN